jgi:hypothetical protein
MISVDYDVLNQRGSPAWFSDVYANIPTAGYKGRMFISIDTYAFYRDTGTGWDLIGGPGTGTITGSGTSGQVSYFNGSSTLAGSNNLFWDITNGRLGIGTTTPGAALDIHSTGTNAQFNGTGTNNAYLVFQNAGTSKWRIGNTYNAGANSFDIYNNGLTLNAISINSTTNNVNFGSTIGNGTYTYTLPSATGTLALTSDLSGYVTLATAQSITGEKQFTNASKTQFFAGISISNTASGGATSGTTTIAANVSGLQVNLAAGGYNNLNFASTTIGNTYTFPNATGTIALTSNLSSYLPLTGGTLTGQLYINPTNIATTGLDVASNTTIIRSDNLEGSKRQLEITMGSGTLIQFTAKGYGANYGTDLAFYTATTSGVNASPGIYITGTNNRVGINTGTPSSPLDVAGEILSSGGQIALSGSGGAPSTGIGIRYNGTFYVYAGANGFNVRNSANSANNFVVLDSGDVGIGSGGSAGNRLIIRGSSTSSGDTSILTQNSAGTNTFYVRNDGYIYTGLATNSPYNYNVTFSPRTAGVDAGGGFGYIVSTKESKGNIKTINNIDYINQLNPVSFNYRKKNNNNTEFIDDVFDDVYYGFIADEVEQINKDLVFYDILPDGTKKLAGVHYNSVIAILTKSIQDLNDKLKRNNIN